MYFTLVTYLVVGLQVLLPLWLLHRLWTRWHPSRLAWLIEATHLTAVLAGLFLIGRWDVVGIHLRYGLYAVYGAVAWASALRVRRLPNRRPGRDWRWGTLAEIALFVGALVWVQVRASSPERGVRLAPPLRGEGVYVVQGGSTPLTNYHGLFAESQSYALDLTRLNGWGLRARGVYPDRLPAYEAFGDTVYSPISAVVTEVVDSLHDQRPPETTPEQPTGNHVWLRRDSLHVVLAHLEHGSVRVEPGDTVAAGEPIARVGNTGNTQEPHLHVHAVGSDPSGAPTLAPELDGARPVPVHFGRGVPLRNDVLDSGASPGTDLSRSSLRRRR